MESPKPSFYVINIHPENWELCLKDHIFGIRTDVSHPKFNKGDVFIVRKTGKEYGVMGVWLLAREEVVKSPDDVPWEDSEYKWQQWFDPVVDFKTPLSEEFSGTSKFSEKLGISSMRLVGSVKKLTHGEVVKYFHLILESKADELLSVTMIDGVSKSAKEIVTRLRDLLVKEAEKPEVPPIVTLKEHGMPVGEPINFRGMIYAPLNEAGVVLLFSKVMDELGIVYESSPIKDFDMVGRQRTEKGYVQKYIEFEFRSSNFKTHGHDASLIDYLVCWEHDWPDCPKDLEVIELREVIKDLPAEFHKDHDSG